NSALSGAGTSSPLSIMSARTCSAIALTFRIASSSEAPYAMTPGSSGTEASTRPSDSRSTSTRIGWISTITSTLSQIQNLLHRPPLILNLPLQEHQRVNQLLRPWRTPRNEHIHRNHLVHRHQRVVVEHASRCRARTHRDHPFRLRHLLIKVPDYRRHFLR